MERQKEKRTREIENGGLWERGERKREREREGGRERDFRYRYRDLGGWLFLLKCSEGFRY